MSEHRSDFEFIDITRHEPDKSAVKVRRQSFAEIYQSFKQPDLKEQSSRCLSCGTPYCQWKCPVHNHIPEWLQLAEQGKYIEAAELSHQTNSLPEVCGRVCPQDRLCEQACTLNDDFGAVTIGQVEKFINDQAFAMGWRPDLSDVRQTDFKVAVIGAGPAGLACADVLARNGIAVTVFDRYPEIGGLLTFGIPEFKLEKRVIENRRTIFESMGIKFKLNTEVGKDIAFESIKQQYHAVFVGLGTYKPVEAGLGEGASSNVIKALDYLIANTSHIHNFEMPDYPLIDLKGKQVVVLGGGDTAMDCLRTAIRQGAKKVTCVYRRDQQSMPGSRKEFKHATEEGVEFIWHQQAIGTVFSSDGNLSHIKCQSLLDQELSEIECEAVIVAYGFRASPPQWLTNLVDVTEDERVIASEHDGYRTSCANIYAGGDMVRGADLVVTAIAEGRQAAKTICQDLGVIS
ncbi:MAG: FAD-dependent oxidoreductase [Kangiellaceae bacterium]|jgi:glutamate synthase (NADPH/NADH) small chain|nr:FAD-dependent oxidoreductase [Kangiellaceae bacterium]